MGPAMIFNSNVVTVTADHVVVSCRAMPISKAFTPHPFQTFYFPFSIILPISYTQYQNIYYILSFVVYISIFLSLILDYWS
jgi:hypothetical protein